MEIPAEEAGVVLEVLINPGDEVSTGQPLLSMELTSSGETTVPETTAARNNCRNNCSRNNCSRKASCHA